MAEEVASLFVKIGADFTELENALSRTRTSIETMGASGGLLGALPLQTKQQANEVVKGIQEAFAPLPAALKSGLEAPINASLSALSVMVAARLGNIIAQVNAAISQINGAISNMPSSGGGNSGGHLPGRATGGSVVSGQPYVVGEKGAELFIPGSSGTIIPNHMIGGNSSGITISGTINVYGVQDVESLYDQLQQVGRQRG